MVLNFDETVPEEGVDVDKGDGKRKTQYSVFRRRRLGYNGRRLRFRPDDDGWVTVMKGAKRDAEREITIPVYNAMCSDKGINHRTNARSMTRQRNDTVQYDRELRCKIDRCAVQRTLELANRKMKNEKKRKDGTKRVKEAFDLLRRQYTSVQVEDNHREIAALRRKQINSGNRQFITGRYQLVVNMGEKMSGDALNAGFQFARSKVPNEKSCHNTYNQVKVDWGTCKSLSLKWEHVFIHRVRHRQLEVEKRRSQQSTKRVFMYSNRTVSVDGVQGKGIHLSDSQSWLMTCLDTSRLCRGLGLARAGLWSGPNVCRDQIVLIRRVATVSDKNQSNVESIHLASIGRRAEMSSVKFEMRQIHRTMLNLRDLRVFRNCIMPKSTARRSALLRPPTSNHNRSSRLGDSACFVSQVNTFGRHRRGSSLMNGLAEAGGYSKFSQHRCRIA
jgi:hypothetical protein